jgi:hypothetical protein
MTRIDILNLSFRLLPIKTRVLAILAAASTAAMAKDLKQDKKATAPTVKATVMNDAEMDKVTAGVNGNAFRACSHAGAGHIPFCL